MNQQELTVLTDLVDMLESQWGKGGTRYKAAFMKAASGGAKEQLELREAMAIQAEMLGVLRFAVDRMQAIRPTLAQAQ